MAVAELPPAVTPRLSRVELQWRDLVRLRGWGAVIGVAAGGLALLLFADAFLNLPPLIRAVGLCVTGVLTVVAFCWRLLLPWSRGMTLADAAAWVEHSHPELQERVLTCLDLEQDATPGSSRAAVLMRRQVRKETLALLESVETDDALPPERAFRAFGLGLLALAVLIAPFGLWTSGYGLSWQRLFNPGGNHGWGRNWLVAGQPGDQIHPRGHDLTVQASAQHRRTAELQPDPLTLHWRAVGAAEWDERRLTTDAETKTFAAVIPRLSTDTEWFVTGPASASPRYRITVVDPPQLTRFTAEVDPLPYTGQPSLLTGVAAELTAPIGALVRLQIELDRPVAKVELHWPQEDHKAATPPTTAVMQTHTCTMSADHRTATVRLRAERSGPFQLTLRSPEGLVVEDDPRRLVVTPDQPPRIELAGKLPVTVRPDDRVEVAITAHDDFALVAAELHVMLSEQDVRNIPLDVATSSNDWSWSPMLDIAELGLSNGQAVTLRARAVDNREWPEAQEAWSAPQVIVVSQSAPSAAERALAQQTSAARHDLQQLLRDLAAHREELRDVHQKTAAATVKQRDAEQAARLEELATKQQELTDQLKHWQDDLPEGGPWEQIRAAAQDVLDEQLAKANAELKSGREAEPREQIEHLSRTLDELAAAQQELQRLDDAVRALGNLGQELGELAQLANRADRLADQLERLEKDKPNDAAVTPEQREWAEQLQRDLAELIEARPELQAAIEQALREQAAAQAGQLADLANRQQQLADAIRGEPQRPGEDVTTNTADATHPANGPGTPASPEFAAGKAAAEQLNQAAEQAARVAETLLNELGPDAAPVEKAIEAARELHTAREAAQKGQLDKAGAQTQQAAANLEQARAEFPAAAAQTPPAQQTQQLAESVKQLAEQLAEVQSSPAAQQGSQAAAQQQLARATAAMSPPAESPPAENPAQQSLAAAQQAMQDAQNSLQAGDTPQAAEDAQQAARQLAQAAEQRQAATPPTDPAENAAPAATGQALTEAERRLQSGQKCLCDSPTSSSQKSSSQPGQSQPGQSQPGQSQPGQSQPGQSPLAQAVTDFRQAGEALRQAVESLTGQPNSPANAAMPQVGAFRAPSGQAQGSDEPAELALPSGPASLLRLEQRLEAASQRNWGRLPGKLQTEILEGGQLPAHPEYARQIQKYFQTIAKPVEEPTP